MIVLVPTAQAVADIHTGNSCCMYDGMMPAMFPNHATLPAAYRLSAGLEEIVWHLIHPDVVLQGVDMHVQHICWNYRITSRGCHRRCRVNVPVGYLLSDEHKLGLQVHLYRPMALIQTSCSSKANNKQQKQQQQQQQNVGHVSSHIT